MTTVDNKDHYTRQHSDDVCGHALALAAKMGLSGDHVRVPRKPGSLTNEEFEVIMQHVVPGKLIIKEIPDLDDQAHPATVNLTLG